MGIPQQETPAGKKFNSLIYFTIFCIIIIAVIANTILQNNDIKQDAKAENLPEKFLIDTINNRHIIFDPISFSEPDIISPFRGAERWHFSSNKEMISNPSEDVFVQSMDIYHRSNLRWDQLETGNGTYDFSILDTIFRNAIRARQKVGFGIMTQMPGQSEGPVAGGSRLCYPEYLHKLMQSDAIEKRDFVAPVDKTFWVPNYNSAYYLSRFESLLLAINKYLEQNSLEGIIYKKALGYVDIRGYGSWGEWHMVSAINSSSDYPQGRRPEAASLIRIINAHINAFTDVPLVSIISVFDGDRLKNTLIPASVGYHALTASNKWGKIGWRRDNWGWREDYLSGWLENNNTIYNNLRFDTAILNRWKYAPVLGEGPCGGTQKGGPCAFYDVPRQVRFYHASMIGNGNFCGEQDNIQARDSMRMAWKLSGYRIIIEQGGIPKSINTASPFLIQLSWKNLGVAPVYEKWNTIFQLQDIQTNRPVWEASSKFNVKGFLPSPNNFTITDTIKNMPSLGNGKYRLVVKIADPSGYRSPLPLAIKGRRPEGTYTLAEEITVVSGKAVKKGSAAGKK